jgi:hypothetical protein
MIIQWKPPCLRIFLSPGPQPCLIRGSAKESVGVLPFDLDPGGQSHHWLLRTHEGHPRRRRGLAMTGLSWIVCPMEIYGKSMNITILQVFLMNWPLSIAILNYLKLSEGTIHFSDFAVNVGKYWSVCHMSSMDGVPFDRGKMLGRYKEHDLPNECQFKGSFAGCGLQ